MAGQTYRYSSAFQLKVISEIESGKYSIAEARRVYDIKGVSTIRYWIIKYGKNHLLNRIIRIQMKDERDQVKELKKKVRLLEKALDKAQVDNLCWKNIKKI